MTTELAAYRMLRSTGYDREGFLDSVDEAWGKVLTMLQNGGDPGDIEPDLELLAGPTDIGGIWVAIRILHLLQDVAEKNLLSHARIQSTTLGKVVDGSTEALHRSENSMIHCRHLSADTWEAYRPLLHQWMPGENVSDLPVREGQFYVAVVGTKHVLCLPRTEGAARRIPHRVAKIEAVRSIGLGVHTPEPLAWSSNDEGFPYLILERLPGDLLSADRLGDRDVAERAAHDYTALLSELRAAGEDQAIRNIFTQESGDRWVRFADEVRRVLFPLMSERGRVRAEEELAALDGLPCLTRALVHGDLGAPNALWEWADGVPHLTGVIDWDDVALNDPAEDLAAVGASYGQPFVQRILTMLPEEDQGIERRISAMSGTFALQQSCCAVRDDDEGALADGLFGYR